MRLRSTILTLIAISLLHPLEAVSQSQGYIATPVTVSKETVTEDGRTFLTHVVLDRQTLFSISKAYGVSIDDLYEANGNLRQEGLKKGQTLLIPVSKESVAAPAAPAPQAQEYTKHIVKWYEDINSIARKYSVTVEAIMKANGLTSPSVSRKQELRIPLHPELEIEHQEIIPEIAVESAMDEDQFHDFEDEVEKTSVKASLVLPFNASSSPNENQFDFYAGALLAIKDLAAEGIDTELDVHDASLKTAGALSGLSETDLVIGPVSTSDIEKALENCSRSTFLVSPLDPKGAALAQTTANLVQAPSSTDAQVTDMVSWLSEELRPSDKVLVFSEKGANLPASASLMIGELERKGIAHKMITYGILEGRNIETTIRGNLSNGGTTRVLIASESEAFVNDVVRNINILLLEKHDMILYGTSRIRNYETIEVNHFHDTKMRVSLSYYIDYDSPEVREFLMQYRALYNAEPSQFAFQGYDTARAFIKARARNGRNWPEKLGRVRGLQSDIMLTKTEDGGYVNTAVRRIIYKEGFAVELQK